MAISAGINTVAGSHYVKVRIPAHAAATATEKVVLNYWDKGVYVLNAWHIPDTIVEGAATNYTNLNIQDEGTDGSGDTEKANIDYSDTVDTAAHDARSFAVTAWAQAAGSVTTLEFEKVSSGLAIPAGMIVIEFEYRDPA